LWAGTHSALQRRDIVTRDFRTGTQSERPGPFNLPSMGHPWVISAFRRKDPMKTQRKWRNPLRAPHLDSTHAAELAAIIVALAAGFSVDAIACRLLEVLDDDPLPL
jgi:hypothetical protein